MHSLLDPQTGLCVSLPKCHSTGAKGMHEIGMHRVDNTLMSPHASPVKQRSREVRSMHKTGMHNSQDRPLTSSHASTLKQRSSTGARCMHGPGFTRADAAVMSPLTSPASKDSSSAVRRLLQLRDGRSTSMRARPVRSSNGQQQHGVRFGQGLSTQVIDHRQCDVAMCDPQSTEVVDQRWEVYLARAREKQALQSGVLEVRGEARLSCQVCTLPLIVCVGPLCCLQAARLSKLHPYRR